MNHPQRVGPAGYAVVLGACQVDAEGSFASWQAGGGIGGAMDPAASGRTVVVMMEHRDSPAGRAKDAKTLVLSTKWL